jgi:hypothetical protein
MNTFFPVGGTPNIISYMEYIEERDDSFEGTGSSDDENVRVEAENVTCSSQILEKSFCIII